MTITKDQIVPHNTDMKIENIDINEIFADKELNCRGEIVPMDVIDLAKSIESVGLQSPVMVQPIPSDVISQNKEGYNPKQHKYRLIVGHRRLKACQILKHTYIPAIIKTNLSDIQTRVLNLQENLERKNLNILQEALAIKKFKEAGYTLKEVANLTGMSTGWVQIRYNLLDLEPEIQQTAAADLITQEQIKALWSLPNKEQRYEAVKRIKDSRLRGEKRAIKVKEKKKNILSKKPRSREEMYEMIAHVISVLGANFGTRCLAWASGEISTLELYQDIKGLAEEQGVPYSIPRDNVAV